MKVVTPFRPFVPESGSHQRLGPFDWDGAAAMLRASVQRHCRCETFVLTDADYRTPAPSLPYQTAERRLMLWLLEVSLAYLQSSDFDQDTALVSPDALVYADLSGWFLADLGVMVRTGKKYRDKPILNGLQLWRHSAQDRLVAFYREALRRGRACSENLLRWGADTTPLVELLSPILAGPSVRAGLSVHGFEAGFHFRTVSWLDESRIDRGLVPLRIPPVVDFKGQRKLLMRNYFNATIGRVAC